MINCHNFKKKLKNQVNIINRIFLFLNYKKIQPVIDKNIRTFYKLKI